jgi:hypothetical protein
MVGEIVGVAEGPGAFFATVDAVGSVRVWSKPGQLRSVFDAGFAAVTVAVPSNRLAITFPGSDILQIVVASWTRGVAAFTVDGAPLWHRRDIRNIHRLCTLPIGAGTGQSRVGVVRERGPGLVLGATGGTRYRLPAARFLSGGADGSVLFHTRSEVHLRPGPDQDPVWRIDLGTFAILDAVLNDETLICGADGRLRLVDCGGLERWNTPVDPARQILRVHSNPAGPGWLALSVPSGGRAGPYQVMTVSHDGDLVAINELAGSLLAFVDGGRRLVAADGTVALSRR